MSVIDIAVIDYGMGNLHSVASAVARVASPQTRIKIVQTATEIDSANRVIFPGQGAALETMQALQRYELVEAIQKAATSKPFFGICLGLQVLFTHSAENSGVDTLGILPGQVEHLRQLIPPTADLKIPHMGWNTVAQTQHPLWQSIQAEAYFYFDHSYVVQPQIADMVSGWTTYGIALPMAVAQDNIFAVQFHPEKSSHAGLQLIKNFCEWDLS